MGGLLIAVDTFALLLRLFLLGVLCMLGRYHRAEAMQYLHDMRQRQAWDEDALPPELLRVIKRQQGLTKAHLLFVRRGHMVEIAFQGRSHHRFFQAQQCACE